MFVQILVLSTEMKIKETKIGREDIQPIERYLKQIWRVPDEGDTAGYQL
jgi:hypothetical protein